MCVCIYVYICMCICICTYVCISYIYTCIHLHQYSFNSVMPTVDSHKGHSPGVPTSCKQSRHPNPPPLADCESV